MAGESVLFDFAAKGGLGVCIADGLRTAARHLKHIHTCENDRGTPGSGHVEWEEVFQAIREIGFDNWLTIESFGSNIPEIAAAAAIWRDLAVTPEAVAFDGIGFLRKRSAGPAAAHGNP